LRNFEDRTNRFRAGFDGSGADRDSFGTSVIRTIVFRTDRNCRIHQPLRHNRGTKAWQYHNSERESGTSSNNRSKQHIAEHDRESNPTNCFSRTADRLTGAGNCFSDSQCNHHPGRNARNHRQSVRDAGYQRHGVQFDHRDSWISAACQLQHSRNYHGAAGDHKSRNYAVGDCKPLPEYAAGYESTDS
jgi:hypothetical protein